MTNKTRRFTWAVRLATLALAVPQIVLAGEPGQTVFTYQGQLKQGGVPTNDTCDFQFGLWDALVEGGQQGLAVNAFAINVEGGLFSHELDFGADAFDGTSRWIEVAVRCPSGAGDFTPLTPRSRVAAAPYAIQTRGLFVDDAGDVGIGTLSPLHPLHVEGGGLGVVFGRHTNAAEEGAGGWFETVSGDGAGVAGFAVSETGGGIGVWGQSDSASGIGVTGFATAESGNTKGVWGITESDDGHAGYFDGRGYFSDAVGIREQNPQAMLHLGGTAGIDGLMFPDGTLQTTAAIGGGGAGSLWSESADVFNNDIFYTSGNVGIGTESNGPRLHVTTPFSSAILAESSDLSGVAVEGRATATTGGPTWGGLFTSASPLGRGIFAHAFSPSGNSVGGLFLNASSVGKGVFAQAYATSGVNYGVYGQTFSDDGYAGYFTGGRNYFQGNVGIGNSAPESLLHITGPDDPIDGPIFTFSPLVPDSVEGGRIRFVETSSNLRGAFVRYDGLSNKLHIGTHQTADSNPSSDTNAITVSRLSGAVGIGMDSPTWPLHVAGLGVFEDRLRVTDGVEIRDGSNNATVELEGSDGSAGRIRVSNPNSSADVVMKGSGLHEGAEVIIRATDGTQTVLLSGDGNGGGGRLRLTNDDGLATIDLIGDDGFDDNSSTITMTNTGSTTVELDGLESGGGVVRVNSDLTGGSAALLGDGLNVAGELQLSNSLGTRTVSVYGDETDAGGANFYYQDGTTVGIELDVEGWSSEAAISLYNQSGIETVRIVADESGDGGDIRLTNALGVETCQIDADYSGSGESRLRVDVVQILGGADLSEQFDIHPAATGGKVEPGVVVSIDPDHIGKLVVSTNPYDRTVAGIVSGAGGVKPGLLMGQRDSAADGAHAVALTGRVWVHTTASNGAIIPGDLLTTSHVAGHAMKVTEHALAQGAIIGKAMSGLDRGEGLVLVLVSLQ